MVRISLMCDRRTRSRFGPNLTHWPAMARVTLSFLAIVILPQSLKAAQQESPNGSRTAQRASPNDSASLPRGKKLMLKDGSFQLVREYRVEGDRVRYYSLDRSQWEEIPATLVDWDQTKKVDANQAQRDTAFVNRVHAQEEAKRAQPLDIDASLEAAPGVFLPPGEGVFVFDNQAVLQVPPAEPSYKTDKKRQVEKVLSPIPILPARHSVLIDGAHAKLRIRTGQPEFYMRTPQDTDPELQIVPARIHGSSRQIANVDQIFRTEGVSAHPLLMQRWEIAKGVYRFTLGQTLEPGEYALVQVIPGRTDLDQLSIYVWDFGVDTLSSSTPKTK
jgi:hypothetical protein